MSTTPSLFDRVASLVNEIGADEAATVKSAMDDPGGAEGPTSHPSKKPDDDEQAATEGEQSADNTKRVKDMIPDSVDSTADATPANVPKDTDHQLGEGVDKAKPTGEDPSTEDDFKGKLTGDKRQGDQGGTTHPASGDYGEKYSADAVAAMSDAELCKAAADLGNEIMADIANGVFSKDAAKPADANAAAKAGEKVAQDTAAASNDLDEIASGVVQDIVKAAYDQADMVTDYIQRKLAAQKRAEGEGEDDDPTSGSENGEDHGSEDASSDPTDAPPAEGGEEAPPEGAEQLLAAMGGEGGGMGGEMGGAPGLEMGGAPGPEMGGAPGPEMGGMGGMGGEMGGPPPEMGAMNDEQALQELAMALLEAGIDPAELAALAGAGGPPEAQKIASAVTDFKRSGKFRFSEAKEGSAQRKVRNYMTGFVTELWQRSRKK